MPHGLGILQYKYTQALEFLLGQSGESLTNPGALERGLQCTKSVDLGTPGRLISERSTHSFVAYRLHAAYCIHLPGL